MEEASVSSAAADISGHFQLEMRTETALFQVVKPFFFLFCLTAECSERELSRGSAVCSSLAPCTNRQPSSCCSVKTGINGTFDQVSFEGAASSFQTPTAADKINPLCSESRSKCRQVRLEQCETWLLLDRGGTWWKRPASNKSHLLILCVELLLS